MGMIGVGLRGTGQVAVQHVEAFAANGHTRIAAICGRSVESAERFRAKYAPEAKIYARYEDMLDDPQVEIVSECMPNYLHAREAILALEADKHLLLEKPAGIAQDEIDALYAAACKAKGKSVVSFLTRWHPLSDSLKALQKQGAFGKLYYVEADYWHGIKPTFSSYDWIRFQQYAGGSMITGGCHAADIARYFAGEVAEVAAFGTRARSDFDFDTTIVASVRYASGAVGKISCSLDGLCFPYQFNIDLLGDGGAARGNQIYSKELFPAQHDWVNLPVETPNSGAVAHHPFKAEINEFVDDILHDTGVRSDVKDACKSMDLALAITESARAGKPVTVKKRV